MTRHCRSLGCALLVLGALPAFSDTPPATSRAVTLADAQRLLARCVQFAATEKLPPLSMVVLDRGGTMLAFLRQDGASAASSDAALAKARTALRAGAPTSALAGVAASDPSTRDLLLELQLTTLAGGVPLPGALGPAGAVGISGASPALDERCAGEAAAGL